MCALTRKLTFRKFGLTFALVLGATSGGCALQDHAANAIHDAKKMTTPKPTDRRDFTEDVEEDWSFVGDEGRKGQAKDIDPDQWWRDYVMSEKARQIEANLGYE